MNTITLSSGYEIPQLGLGTWQLTGKTCETTVEQALAMGYTHIDTAEMYGNHGEIGSALLKLGWNHGDKREKLFITSKVWQSNLRREAAIESCNNALKELNIEYLDLLLIHWPNDSVPVSETLSAFAELVEDGKVRSIGVSNFTGKKVEEAVRESDLPIAVNQVECHPFLNQKKLKQKCDDLDVALTAYSPLGRGRVMKDDTLKEIAEGNGKTPAQTALRWQIQRGVIVIPKSSSEAHLQANMAVWGWELSDEEMNKISSIEEEKRQRIIDPDFADFDED